MAEKTGWSMDDILDMPFLQVNLMLADAPRLKKRGEEAQRLTSDEELANFFGTKISK